jgi:hypothetical protein
MSVERAGWMAEHPVRDGKVEVVTSEWAWEIKAERDAARAEASGLRKRLADAEAEVERLRAERDGLGESAVAISRDRDQQVALYEAAMNWFSEEQWREFEESDLFKAAEALDGGEYA